MKFYIYIQLIFTIIIFSNCKKTVEKQPKPTIYTIKDTIFKKNIPQKKIEKKIIKPWDSLNYNNVTSFFTQYGKLNKENKVLLKTEFGNIRLRLFNETPIHRASFIFLTKIGYFDTTVFHRIAKDMAIQGGESDEENSSKIRNKYKNFRLPAEISKKRKHKYGTLALARELNNNPNKESNPFNFYIVSNRTGAHHLDGDYTIFGEVISGFSTIKKIAKVKTGYSDWPIKDIHMTIEVIK